MDPDQDSSMLLLTPTIAMEVMQALSNLADAMEGLIDLRTEEPLEKKATPPSLTNRGECSRLDDEKPGPVHRQISEERRTQS